ncbi:uncharacterized protein LOC131478620 [Ochotona princeps]|uniref:uncharacterized protein LOC131478620 n=1 Tax=Ochotona princeps TaxID=9978 RepID=UPI00271493F3|nr:uncharacterized protein LOC131478620 [Ochotona princeps]
MSRRKQEAALPETEGSVPGCLQLEEVSPGLHGDDNTCKPEDNPLLNYTKSFLHQHGVPQENNVSNPNDKDLQNVPIKEEDENSDNDSDTDDNVRITIGNINTNLSLYRAMLANLNAQGSQTFGTSEKGTDPSDCYILTEDAWRAYCDNQYDASRVTNMILSPPVQTKDNNLMSHADNVKKECQNVSETELNTDSSPFLVEQLKAEPLPKLLQEKREDQDSQSSKHSKYEQDPDVSSKAN